MSVTEKVIKNASNLRKLHQIEVLYPIYHLYDLIKSHCQKLKELEIFGKFSTVDRKYDVFAKTITMDDIRHNLRNYGLYTTFVLSNEETT